MKSVEEFGEIKGLQKKFIINLKDTLDGDIVPVMYDALKKVVI